MRKLTGHIFAVAGRLLFIGFTLQIIFGMIWMVGNFVHCQQFGEVNSLLYPAVLMIAKGMGRVFPVPYYCFVYIIQTGICFCAVYFFLKIIQDIFSGKCCGISNNHEKGKACGKLFRIWAVLAVLTAVPVMQCMLALLPYALTGALMLIELGLAIKAIYYRGMQRVSDVVKISAVWVLQALFLHEYMLFGAIPVFMVLISELQWGLKNGRRTLRRASYYVAAIAVSLGMLTAVYGSCKQIGLYEEKNPGFVKGLFSRTCLTTVLWDWDTWTDELVEQLAWEVRYSAAYYADNITLEVEPYIDEKYGDEAGEFYLDTIGVAWESYKTQIIHELLWDAAGYSVSPVIVKRQLSGLGYMSLTARNYDMMKRSTPKLTKYYVNFFLDWFIAALAVFAICVVAAVLNLLRRVKKPQLMCLLTLIATAVCMCIRYVLMGAGIMDYKRTLMITALWIIFMLFPIHAAFFGMDKTDKQEAGKAE